MNANRTSSGLNHQFQKIPKQVIDSMPFGVIITDVELRIIKLNQWMLAHFDLEMEQVRYQNLGEVFPEIEGRNLLEAYNLVLQSQLPLTLSNRIHHHLLRIPLSEHDLLDTMAQSTVITPLLDGEELVGTSTFIMDVTDRVISERSLQREVDKLNVLHEVDHALATLDLAECLQVITQRARALFDSDRVVFYFHEKGELHIGGYASSNAVKSPPNRELASWVAIHHEPELLPDTHKDIRYSDMLPDYRSEMAAPLLVEGKCIGVLNVQSHKLKAYTIDDMDLLSVLAARAATAINNARLHEAEQRQREFAEALQEVALALTRDLDPEAVFDAILNNISKVVPYDSASLISVRDRIAIIERQHGYEDFVSKPYDAERRPFNLDRFWFLEHMYDEQQTFVIPDVNQEQQWIVTPRTSHVNSWAGVPIIVRGRVIGLLCLDHIQPGFYTEEMIPKLKAFAAHAGIAMENARLYEKQVYLARTDGLTGLTNRREFDHRLNQEINRALRFERPISLIMLDIDNFKFFNDTYGHPVGDDLLRQLSAVLLDNVRVVDIAARYGGEEFAIILPETGIDDAYLVAERIRKRVAKLKEKPLLTDIPIPDTLVTISLGVACVPDHAKTPEGLIKVADVALYQAKQSGKNKVVKYSL
jgi:diguanylate cyclase (GGDEF)-like protein